MNGDFINQRLPRLFYLVSIFSFLNTVLIGLMFFMHISLEIDMQKALDNQDSMREEMKGIHLIDGKLMLIIKNSHHLSGLEPECVECHTVHTDKLH
jgi:hypothetical protein